jgi:hypothetical protein
MPTENEENAIIVYTSGDFFKNYYNLPRGTWLVWADKGEKSL